MELLSVKEILNWTVTPGAPGIGATLQGPAKLLRLGVAGIRRNRRNQINMWNLFPGGSKDGIIEIGLGEILFSVGLGEILKIIIVFWNDPK